MQKEQKNQEEKEYEDELIQLIQTNLPIWQYVDNELFTKNYEKHGFYGSYDILIQKIKELNPSYANNYDLINDTVSKVTNLISKVPYICNQEAMKFFINGIKVFNKNLKKTVTIKIVDIDNEKNNIYQFTRQLNVNTNDSSSRFKIPDLLFFLNGLCIIVCELKSSSRDDSSLDQAVDQINFYKETLDHSIFAFNILNIVSNKTLNYYGSLTAKTLQEYSHWKKWNYKEKQPDDYIFFFNNLFQPKILFDLIDNFTFFPKTNGKIVKIIGAYQQYFGVNEAITKLEKTYYLTNKIGTFWHTQGSGKSLSMVFFVQKMQKLKPFLTTIVVADRIALNEQLFNTFFLASDFLHQSIKKIESIRDLEKEVKDIKQGKIFLTTIQKFDDSVSNLSDRDDILVIADEAHRTERTENPVKRLDENAVFEEYYSYAANLRRVLPNAHYVGFTATPIIEKNNNGYQTTKVFGDYLSIYTLSQATEDGFIVNINYNKPENNLSVNIEKVKESEIIYNQAKQEIQESSLLPITINNKLEKEYKKYELIFQSKERIDKFVNFFIQQYEKIKDILFGKAMIVAFNRKVALQYYDGILSKKPEWKDNVKLVLSYNETKDYSVYGDKVVKKDELKNVSNEFKKEKGSVKIVIVVDMWLTGYDNPLLDTMFLDTVLKMHNLMQAITRVDRRYKNKDHGLIIDTAGNGENLKKAYKFYNCININNYNNDKQFSNLDLIVSKFYSELKQLKEKFNIDDETVLNKYKEFNLDNTKTNINNSSIIFIEMLNELYENVINESFQNKQKYFQQFIFMVKNIKKLYKQIQHILNDNDLILFTLILISFTKWFIDNQMDEWREYKERAKILARNIYDNAISFDIKESEDQISLNDIPIENELNFLENSEKDKCLYITETIAENIINNFEKNFSLNKNLVNSLKDVLQKYKNHQIQTKALIDEFKIICKNHNQEFNEILNSLKLSGFLKDIFKIIYENTNIREVNLLKNALSSIQETIDKELIDRSNVDLSTYKRDKLIFKLRRYLELNFSDIDEVNRQTISEMIVNKYAKYLKHVNY